MSERWQDERGTVMYVHYQEPWVRIRLVPFLFCLFFAFLFSPGVLWLPQQGATFIQMWHNREKDFVVLRLLASNLVVEPTLVSIRAYSSSFVELNRISLSINIIFVVAVAVGSFKKLRCTQKLKKTT